MVEIGRGYNEICVNDHGSSQTGTLSPNRIMN